VQGDGPFLSFLEEKYYSSHNGAEKIAVKRVVEAIGFAFFVLAELSRDAIIM